MKGITYHYVAGAPLPWHCLTMRYGSPVCGWGRTRDEAARHLQSRLVEGDEEYAASLVQLEDEQPIEDLADQDEYQAERWAEAWDRR